ncbi:MAG: AIM24 family protein [Armatimonadota bacterium]|nr:AIM24 family protein [Armatimonadota bacterium]
MTPTPYQISGSAPGQYHCPWCGAACDPHTVSSCPGCGSPLDVRAVSDRAGWYEMPPIKDMAKLQFGQSFVQIEGAYTPVADFKLDAADHIYFSHHILLWKDPHIEVTVMPLAGGWKRMLAGMPLIMTQAHGPGRIAFSQDAPGETLAIRLQPGQSVDVREGVFMVATGQVNYDWFNTGFWYTTEGGTRYPLGQFMDRFTAGTAPGLLLLHGAGNAFVRNLQPGQSILVKPTSLLYKDDSVQMTLNLEHPRGYNQVWSRRYVWLKLSGPGRVAIQSSSHHWEDPPEPVMNSSAGSRVIDW